VHPAPPAVLELAFRLRHLRTEQWQDCKLTQSALAWALGTSPATVASWESKTNPKLPSRERLVAYAQFFATSRSLGPEPALVPLDSFTSGEQASYDALLGELLRLHSAARGGAAADVPIAARRSWYFSDCGPLTLVCSRLPKDEAPSIADPGNPNYTHLAGFGDLDALVELHGHVRAQNPGMGVFFKTAPDVKADDLSGHIVIIGGIDWNDVTRRIMDLSQLPVRQVEDPAVAEGEIFVAYADDGERKYLPQRSPLTDKLAQDVGLIVRMRNPLNSNRSLTICNGIHSRGVLGAVRTLTDVRLRESNEQYIARNFPEDHFGILMRVQVIEGETLTPDFNSVGTVLYQWPVKAQP
jgi:transcriptional regulator with XRE-family HTH domain